MREWKLSGAVSYLRFGAEVDDAHDCRREDYPRELVPVKKGEAEEGGGGASVQCGEAEAEVGQDEEKRPGREAAAVMSGGGGHLLRRVGPRMGSHAPMESTASIAAKRCIFFPCETRAYTL